MIRCFELSINAAHKSGVRIITAVGPTAYTKDPVTKVMKSWYGPNSDGIDLSYHEIPGNKYKPIYDTESARTEIGFVAEIDLRKECLNIN